jgi:2-polyprenyl-6-methoxyphenol hydroxylase-like FAD-dependent oxidoreductase
VPHIDLPEEVDVLIVGAGPVGSALALDLARRGLRPLVLERRTEISNVGVRARNISIRTMELARRWGVADALRAARTLPREWDRGWHAVTRVRGYPLHPPVRDDVVMWSPRERWEKLGPEPPLDLPQYQFNRVIRERALQLGASVATGWEVDEVTLLDDAAIVAARATNDSAVAEIRARWLVGCDGARSVVRRSAGIVLEETEPVGRMLNVTFHFPNAFDQIGRDPAIQFMVVNQQVRGLVHPYEEDWWRIGMGPIPLSVDHRELDLEQQIRRYLGFDAEIDTINVSTHLVQRRIAERYREGRAILAGDAAVAFPPHLGQNLNTGVADAATLGWVLAGLVQGWGDEGLVDGYAHERRESSLQLTEGTMGVVGAWMEINEQIRRSDQLESETPAGEAQRTALGALIAPLLGTVPDGVIFDPRFPDSPIVLGDGTPPPPFDPAAVTPAAIAGHRAPHLWLRDGTALGDHFGVDFTLLDLGAEPGEVASIVAAMRAATTPMAVLAVADEAVRQAYAARLVLVRPDHIVAWRGDRAPADPGRLAAVVTGRRAQPDALPVLPTEVIA